LIEFIEENLKLNGYQNLYNKNNLHVEYFNGGSIFNKQNSIFKSVFKLAKNLLKKSITIEFIKNIIFVPEKRMKWDNSFKEYKLLEGKDGVYVTRSWLKSPMFMVSERDFIDKRIDFFNKDVYYNFTSAVDDNVIRVIFNFK